MTSHTGMALVSLAIDPKTPMDAQRLADALQRLTAEDATLRVRAGRIPGQVIIGGVSDLHLEIVVDRMKREFKVEAYIGRPVVAYLGALTLAAEGEAKYANQTGGRGMYGHVKIRLYPGQPGTGYVFENHINDGVIPTEFIQAVEQGIQDALTHGVLTCDPIDNARIELYDGSYHDVDSSEAAFRIAGSLAVADAVRKADPIVLEPVMLVEVIVPAECCRDVMKDLVTRRGQIRSQQDSGDTQVIRALVPLADLFGYATDLRSRTRGRGTYAMRFENYMPVQVVDDDDGGESLVSEPRTPPLPLGRSGIALPEPDEDE